MNCVFLIYDGWLSRIGSNNQTWLVMYVTLIVLPGTLEGVADKIDYLKELGITYLHLMPLLKPRPGANDGGYAVMDYRQVRQDLGTIEDLA